MSLNGLDDGSVAEALEVFVSEAEAWLLVKYASRDQVALLGHGRAGIGEMGSAIGNYTEMNPLYGLVGYGSKRVVVKYLPDDCSRLMQARVAVHFDAICERFAPYDTWLEISAADQLTESRLASACSLHSSSASVSSTTTWQRRRRQAEDAVDQQQYQQQKRQSLQHDSPAGSASLVASLAEPEPVVELDPSLPSSLSDGQYPGDSMAEPPTFVGAENRPTSPAQSSDAHPAMFRADAATYPSHLYAKHRVKLAPRPSADVKGRPTGGRPQTAGNFRPVSAIPAGFKLFGKGSRKGKTKGHSTPASPQHEQDSNLDLAIPEESLRTHDDTARPATSSGLVEDRRPTVALKKATVSPEKARLMKAMKLREKKRKNKDKDTMSRPEATAAGWECGGGVTEASEQVDDEGHQAQQEDEGGQCVDAEHAGGHSGDPQRRRYDDLAPADSQPASPAVAFSEAERSTKPSSVSESTDDPVEAKDEAVLLLSGEQTMATAATMTMMMTTASNDDTTMTTTATRDDETSSSTTTTRDDEISTTTTTIITTTTTTTRDDKTLKTIRDDETSSSTTTARDGETSTATARDGETSSSSTTTTTITATATATEQPQPQPQLSHSVSHLLDDEDLMQELQSATLEQAQPMPVARSPFSAATCTGKSGQQAPRTVSNPTVVPTRGRMAEATQGATRSMSSGAPANLAKKPNIGSSISQRIKALEKVSGTIGEGGAPSSSLRSSAPSRERPSSTFFAVKKREPSRSPSFMDKAEAGEGATRVQRSGSVTSRLTMFDQAPAGGIKRAPTPQAQRGRPESVSVTARIVRPDLMQHAGQQSELRQSPLVVDHHGAPPSSSPWSDLRHNDLRHSDSRHDEPPSAASRDTSRDASRDASRTRHSHSSSLSISMVKDLIKPRGLGQSDASRSPQHNSVVFSPRLSVSSRDHESPATSSTAVDAQSLAVDGEPSAADGKLSRAGRFMRRLSTLSGSRGKHPATDSVSEQHQRQQQHHHQHHQQLDDDAAPPHTPATPTIVSYMGDVNVQFPDNLLWKRRNMCLDSNGFLVLGLLPAQTSRQAHASKRYHMSQFRAPYMPDVEVQELPNSVVLDFLRGMSIQVACEDRAGQKNVLDILQQAHALAHSS